MGWECRCGESAWESRESGWKCKKIWGIKDGDAENQGGNLCIMAEMT